MHKNMWPRILLAAVGVLLLTAAVLLASSYYLVQARQQMWMGQAVVFEGLAPKLAEFMEHEQRCPSPTELQALLPSSDIPPLVATVGEPWNSAALSAAQGCTFFVQMKDDGQLSRRVAGQHIAITYSLDGEGGFRHFCQSTGDEDVINTSNMYGCEHVEKIGPPYRRPNGS